jgi:UDP-N-acetylglucosamine transferase subunit ALG13
MIFATVGTHNQPFERFLQALAALEDDVVVQYGPNERPAWAARAVRFMDFEAVMTAMREADAVVTHAGVGSILCARTLGHVPIVMPRLARLGEHVDDHQVQLCNALSKAGRVIVAWRSEDLPVAVAEARERATPEALHETPLHAAVRAALVPAPAGAR